MTLLAEADSLTRVTATHHQIPSPAMLPPAPPYGRPRHFPLNAIATLIVGLIATAALVVGIVGLSRDNADQASDAIPAATGPSFSTADSAAAKQKVCAVFEQGGDAVRVSTNAPYGTEPAAVRANGRAALTASALALTRATSEATPSEVAAAANSLADAYVDYALTAFAERTSDTAAIENATIAMREACA